MQVAVRLLDPRLRAWGFPRRGSTGSAGLDLHACLEAPLVLQPQAPAVLIPAGIVVTIGDPGWCGLVYPRSGSGHRDGLVLGNGTGVIDADYAGPILISAWNRNPAAPGGGASRPITIEPGDRIAQLVFTRIVQPDLLVSDADAVSDDPSPAEGRGAGGFGSSGRR